MINVFKETLVLGEALKALLLFATTFLCETGLSVLTVTKTKYRSRFQPEDNLRCNLLSKLPKFLKLIETIQCRESHWEYNGVALKSLYLVLFLPHVARNTIVFKFKLSITFIRAWVVMVGFWVAAEKV